MDAESWNARLSSASKSYKSALQLRSDLYMGFEEIEGDEGMREEFPCPFCSEYFDIVGLCCHIDDEHSLEAKHGRKSRKVGSHLPLSLLRKELRDGNLQSLFGGSCMLSSSNTAPDPLLSSFILPMADESVSAQPGFWPETVSIKKGSEKILSDSERHAQSPSLSTKDKQEKTQRSEFVQGLLMSMIFEDHL